MKILNNSQGITLIEIFISLVILSISLLGFGNLMVTTTKNNSYGSHVTEAVIFAQENLEGFRAVRWENIVPNSMGTDQRLDCTGINYIRTWDTVQNANVKTIGITSNWNDHTNHSMRLSSVISQ